jgi:hypothetical protein
MINTKTYPIVNNVLLTNEILDSYINNFWSDVFTNIKDTSHLMLMCKVQFTESQDSNSLGYRTLGHLVKVNYSDKELFIEYLQERLNYNI